MLEKLTREDFLPLVGTSFRVKTDSGSDVDLKLQEVRDLGPRPERLVKAGTRASAFSLRFVGPATGFLPQRTWSLTHEAFGAISIFLVPIGRAEEGFQYESIFN
jgi:hypothetical protein